MDLVTLILHPQNYLPFILENYGNGLLVLLFLIVFCETGLVFMPFLPGDSLLFATGALAAVSGLNLPAIWVILAIAAVSGDALNYTVGRFFGDKLLTKTKLVRKDYLEKSKKYFDENGKKSIILARFIPIFRTFVPFVAGISGMSYSRFSAYNVVGGVLWTGVFLSTGYFFAEVPFVKENFSHVLLAIIAVSLTPPLWDLFQIWKKRRQLKQNERHGI